MDVLMSLSNNFGRLLYINNCNIPSTDINNAEISSEPILNSLQTELQNFIDTDTTDSDSDTAPNLTYLHDFDEDLLDNVDDAIGVIGKSGFHCDIIIPGCLDVGSNDDVFVLNNKTYTCKKYTQSCLIEMNLYSLPKALLTVTSKENVQLQKSDALMLLAEKGFLHTESDDNNILHHVVNLSNTLRVHYILFKLSDCIIENTWKGLIKGGFCVYKIKYHDEVLYPVRLFLKDAIVDNLSYNFICEKIMVTEYNTYNWEEIGYIGFTAKDLVKIMSELTIKIQKID